MIRRGLGPAHRGYLYQDIASAYALAKGLLKPFGEALVDRKLFDGDIFDDLSLVLSSGGLRVQFKSGHGQPLEEQDLSGLGLNARIDHLVSSAIQSPADYADLRLCVSRSAPASEWKTLLRPSAHPQFFAGSLSEVFELDAVALWPENGKPRWSVLEGVKREDFLAFGSRFHLEIACPKASLDLGAPGPLETLLFKALEEDIGVGAYPNESLNLVDSAARLILLVQHARANETSLVPAQIIRELRLQTDFGRISQSFPVVSSHQVQTDDLQSKLRTATLNGGVTALVGPPGSGKSWSLTGLASDLVEEGAVVARHYCYLEPGDADVQLRITTRRAFSNLLAEIIDQRPALAESNRPYYAAGALQLQRVLETLSDRGERVVLIVDGLDHIARVLVEARDLAPDETDIIDELAALRLPANVSLIIGSQPGRHLDGLPVGSNSIEVPPWIQGQTDDLARRVGAVASLGRRGSIDTTAALKRIHDTADGNPLYATFLCREVVKRIESGHALQMEDLFADLPQGNLALYYAFLLRSVPIGAVSVAELLGLIDFGVTVGELCEIFPLIAGLIRGTIASLSPILRNVASQGGVRIYHESFRRYIVEEMQRRNEPIADKLVPVIDWLKRREFLEDSKAYRFLLPCLRRAGRVDELLRLIGADFISNSVANGQPQMAVWSNLQIGIHVAAEQRRWPELVRFAELHRTLHTCFEEKLLDIDLYGRTFATLFGPKALVERLLFDGRPTLSSPAGLLMCSLSDDLGEVPPWEAYLGLPEDSSEDRDASRALSRTHGIIRTVPLDELLDRVKQWLAEADPNPNDRYFRGVVQRLGAKLGSRFLAAILRTGKGSDRVRLNLRIELAKTLGREGREARAKMLATAILKRCVDPGDALACLRIGADPAAAVSVDLAAASTDVLAPMVEHDETRIIRWRQALGVLAFTRPQELDGIAKGILPESWYRYWLLFLIELARLEPEKRESPERAEQRALQAIGLLVKEVHPFAGDPRACDLYRLHGEIFDSIDVALKTLRARDSWVAALNNLETVTVKTTTFLQNSPNGPLTREAFCRLILSHMVSGTPLDILCEAVGKIVVPAHESGYYYESLAEHEMYFARALITAGKRSEALAAWQRAAVYLTGYGFRKDSTVFELIDALPALHRINAGWAIDALRKVQRLIRAVIAHTDGKTTRHAPGHWFDAVVKCEPLKAIDLLAESLIARGGQVSGTLEQGVEKVLSSSRSSADPLLIHFLDSTNPPVDSKSRIDLMRRLKAQDSEAFARILPVAVAEAQGDCYEYRHADFECLLAFARQEGLGSGQPSYPFDAEVTSKSASDLDYTRQRNPFAVRSPFFSVNSDSSDMLATFRRLRRLDEESDFEDRLANGVGYRILELLQRERQREALRVLHSFATEYYTYSEKASALAALAEGLERYGYREIAAVAYALAYARSRGGGGWLYLGGVEQQPWLSKASQLSSVTAQSTMAREIARILETPGFIIGITRHLAELSSPWLPGAERLAIWEAAYDVINRRLPTSQDDPDPFVPIRESLAQGMQQDDALGYLLLSRLSHPELERKKAALAGLSAVLAGKPLILEQGLAKCFSRDTPESTLSLLLAAMWQWEPAPFELSKTLSRQLEILSGSANFTQGQLATRLLARAGLPGSRGYSRVILRGAGLSSRDEIELALSVDVADRVNLIASRWPGIRAEVAARFDEYWKQSAINKSRAASRHEAARSSAQRNIPPTFMYWWESELFDIALNDSLSQLEALAWSEGEWTQERMDSLVALVNPNLKMHRALWMTRRVRPPIPIPSCVKEGATTLQPIANEGEFDGWYRLAVHERQAILDKPTYPTFKGWREVYAGALIGGLKGYDRETLPLASAGPDLWDPPARPTGIFKPAIGRALVSLFVQRDRLGLDHILSLDSQIVALLGLVSRADSLNLVDSSGQNRVVFRRWRVRPMGADFDEEMPVLTGCNLLIHPESYSRVLQACGADISLVTAVSESRTGPDD